MSDVDVGFNSLSEPVDYEDFVVGESSVDLRAFHVVGGVLHFNLLQMPPQPKVIRGWTITQCMCCSVLIDVALIFSCHISPLSVSEFCHDFWCENSKMDKLLEAIKPR